MAVSGHLSRLCIVLAGGLLATFSLLALLQGEPGIIKSVCSEAEVVERCHPWLNITLTGTATAEECKWLHHGHGSQKPCCYHDPRDGFASSDVCDQNLMSSADQKTCRTGPRKPEVKIDGSNCTIIIKNPDSRDTGLYEGCMPYKSKLPQKESNVGYDDICSKTVKSFCIFKLWLILFALCITALLLITTPVMICGKNIFPCYYNYVNVQQEQEQPVQIEMN